MKKLFAFLVVFVVCVGAISAEIVERVSIGDLVYNLDTDKAVAEVTFSTPHPPRQ